jgi:hypothetical protein
VYQIEEMRRQRRPLQRSWFEWPDTWTVFAIRGTKLTLQAIPTWILNNGKVIVMIEVIRKLIDHSST